MTDEIKGRPKVNAGRKRQARQSWGKAIPQERDHIQSEVLTGAVGMLLAAKLAVETVQMRGWGEVPGWFWIACGVSAGFAVVVWVLRSATGPAAAIGGVVCLHVLMRQELAVGWQQTAMPSLLALFMLTYAATRFGRSRKESLGVAEGKHGRRASQVVANLGVAGLFAAGGAAGSMTSTVMLAACIAALAEATADTVSSEVGQALGGKTLLITTGKAVAAGTDGGVSVAGTACGAFTAAVVVALSPLAHDVEMAVGVFVAACAGLIFDSVLGATVERNGWLGNDLVNFASTAFAAAVAWGFVASI